MNGAREQEKNKIKTRIGLAIQFPWLNINFSCDVENWKEFFVSFGVLLKLSVALNLIGIITNWIFNQIQHENLHNVEDVF